MRGDNLKNRGSTPVGPRLWAKVIKTDTCWIWQGGTKGGGYGVIRIGAGKDRRQYLTHRISYEIAYGPIPLGLQVLHKCDTPACVRPDHLFLGTQLDNMRDKIAKGRANITLPYHPAKHEGHGMSKLTAAIVNQIRSEYKPRVVSLNMLAERYGIAKKTILNVIQHNTWKF